MTPFFFTLLILAIVVFVHEWGHFIVARLCKLPVERFSVGFGPVIFEYKDKKKTIWQVSGLPLGGYVQIAQNKLFGLKKILVSVAGPLMNFIFALVVFFSTFMMFGALHVVPVIQEVLPKSLAMEHDIRAKDEVLHVNGQAFEKMQLALKKGAKVTLEIKRDQEVLTKEIIMTEDKLGIIFGTAIRSVSLWEALKGSSYMVIDLTQKIVKGLFSWVGFKQIGGVLSVFSVSKAQYQSGWQSFLMFVGVFSVNLGVLNLFPIPILDGGHILVGFYEMITKRRVNKIIYQRMMIVGLSILFTLFVISLLNDFGWRF